SREACQGLHGWRRPPSLDGDHQGIALEGPPTNEAGVALAWALRHNWADNRTRIDAKLAELFLRAGNPLAATLADWPQTLELTTGRIQAQGRVEMLGDNPPNLTATLIAKGVGGIFDRTEVSGLDAELKLGLQRDR